MERYTTSTLQISVSPANCSILQGGPREAWSKHASANFSSQEPHGKYFRLSGSHTLCGNYSHLLSSSKRVIDYMTICKQKSMAIVLHIHYSKTNYYTFTSLHQHTFIISQLPWVRSLSPSRGISQGCNHGQLGLHSHLQA